MGGGRGSCAAAAPRPGCASQCQGPRPHPCSRWAPGSCPSASAPPPLGRGSSRCLRREPSASRKQSSPSPPPPPPALGRPPSPPALRAQLAASRVCWDRALGPRRGPSPLRERCGAPVHTLFHRPFPVGVTRFPKPQRLGPGPRPGQGLEARSWTGPGTERGAGTLRVLGLDDPGADEHGPDSWPGCHQHRSGSHGPALSPQRVNSAREQSTGWGETLGRRGAVIITPPYAPEATAHSR